MGISDLYGKTYFDDKEHFAALFNGILYHGNTVISASELEDADAEVINLLSGNAKQQIADRAKRWRGQLLVLLLLENQTYIDYHMVLRVMQMETAQYMLQWRKLKKEHQKKGDLSGDELLSGMKKEEKFQPVILLTVYYNPRKAWDGARTLHELVLMGEDTKQMNTFINNYKINLFDFHEYDDFSNFSEPLRAFFGFLRYCTEKEALKEYLERNKTVFEKLDPETAIFLSSVANIREIEKYRMDGKDEVTYNMCKAFEDMRLEGIEQGIERGILLAIRNLMESMQLSVEQAMEALKIPMEKQVVYLEQIRK